MQSTRPWFVVALVAVVGCGGSTENSLGSAATETSASDERLARASLLENIDVTTERLADGSVCFEVLTTDGEWVVNRDCWTPPFVHAWDLVAFGTIGDDDAVSVTASLLITSTGAEAKQISLKGDDLVWQQSGPAVVVLTDFTPTGDAPVDVEYMIDGEVKGCSVGPPQTVCPIG